MKLRSSVGRPVEIVRIVLRLVSGDANTSSGEEIIQFKLQNDRSQQLVWKGNECTLRMCCSSSTLEMSVNRRIDEWRGFLPMGDVVLCSIFSDIGEILTLWGKLGGVDRRVQVGHWNSQLGVGNHHHVSYCNRGVTWA